jgi:hypothetical protein
MNSDAQMIPLVEQFDYTILEQVDSTFTLPAALAGRAPEPAPHEGYRQPAADKHGNYPGRRRRKDESPKLPVKIAEDIKKYETKKYRLRDAPPAHPSASFLR